MPLIFEVITQFFDICGQRGEVMDIVNVQSYYCHYPPRMFFDFPTSREVRNKVVAATAQSATLRTVKVAHRAISRSASLNLFMAGK